MDEDLQVFKKRNKLHPQVVKTGSIEKDFIEDNDGLKSCLKQALAYLLEFKPSEPYSFLSDYLFHASQKSNKNNHHQGDLFISYFLLTQFSWKDLVLKGGKLGKVIGQSFELLVHPSLPSSDSSCVPSGIKLKDFFTLATLFKGSFLDPPLSSPPLPVNITNWTLFNWL